MTGQAGKVGRGLRSIGANIAKLATDAGELEYNVNGVTKSISLFDETTGDMKNTYQVLSEVAGGWDSMTNSEKSALALSLAGKTQIDVFTSVLGNFDDAVKATSTSINSAGSATKENAKYMESLSAKINNLKAQAQKLVLGDGGLNSLLKTLIDLGTGILKFANSDLGQAIIKMTTLITAVNLLYKGFSALEIASKLSALYTQLTTATVTLAGGMGVMVTGTQSLVVGLLNVAKAWALTPMGMTTIAIAGIAILGTAINKVYESTEELRESVSKLTTETKDLQSEFDSLSQKDNLTENEKTRLSLLQSQIEANKTLIQQEYEKASASQQYEETSRATFEGGTKHVKKDVSTEKGALGLDVENATISQSIEAYKTLQNVKASSLEQDTKIEEQKASLINKLSEEGQYLLDLKDKGIDLVKEDQARLDAIIAITGELSNKNDVTNSAIVLDEDLSEKEDDTTSASEDLASALGLTASQSKDLTSEMSDNNESALEAADSLGYLSDGYNDAVSGLTDMQDAYDTLTSAVDEYNSTGELSLQSVTNLLSLEPQYLSLLNDEGSQLSINEQGVENLANAKIDLAEAYAIAQTQANLESIANGTLSDTLDTITTSAGTVSQNVLDAGQDAVTSGNNATTGAIGWSTFWASMTNSAGVDVTAKNKKAIQEQEKTLKNSLTTLEGLRGKLGQYTSAASKASKSAGSAAKSTTDTYKEEYEKQKDDLDHKLAMEEISQEDYYKKLYALNEQYFGEASGHHQEYLDEYQKNEETMYKGIKSMLKDRADDVKDALKDQEDAAIDAMDKQIDAVKNAESVALDAIDNQIDALKDQKDAALDAIDAEIEATKKEKDACETYWNNKIDAFKKANDELTEQNKLMELQQALAAAQSTKVKIFQGGQFTYGQDEEAVDTAQENLDEYQDELKYEKELQALEDSRDAALEVYDQKIEDLQNYRDSVEEQYDAEIEAMENHRDEVQEQYDAELDALEAQKEALKKQYDSQIENYEAKEKQLFDDQVDAITSENNNWTVRLQNLAAFVTQYNSMINSLNSKSAVTSSYKGVSVKTRASGDSSINESGAYIVGENPNKEIVLGSKLNNGVGINLSKGSGVVNAKSTSTLAGLLNNLGEISGIGATSNNNTTKSVNNNFNITANVANGEGLVDYLQNFSTRMTQQAFA